MPVYSIYATGQNMCNMRECARYIYARKDRKFEVCKTQIYLQNMRQKHNVYGEEAQFHWGDEK